MDAICWIPSSDSIEVRLLQQGPVDEQADRGALRGARPAIAHRAGRSSGPRWSIASPGGAAIPWLVTRTAGPSTRATGSSTNWAAAVTTCSHRRAPAEPCDGGADRRCARSPLGSRGARWRRCPSCPAGCRGRRRPPRPVILVAMDEVGEIGEPDAPRERLQVLGGDLQRQAGLAGAAAAGEGAPGGCRRSGVVAARSRAAPDELG